MPPGSTPTSDQELEQRLQEVRYGLSVEEGKLSGSAAPVLTSAIAEAQYVLIGEDHLTCEIPQFTKAICNTVAKQGLSGVAVETSPEAAEFVARSLDAPDRWSRMVALAREYPSSVAFMDDRQENDLVAHCARVSDNPKFQLWGLDQNFLGSAGWLIDQMLAKHPGPAADAELIHLKLEEQADAVHARQTGSYNDLFMIAVSDEELRRALPIHILARAPPDFCPKRDVVPEKFRPALECRYRGCCCRARLRRYGRDPCEPGGLRISHFCLQRHAFTRSRARPPWCSDRRSERGLEGHLHGHKQIYLRTCSGRLDE
jgi:hypothetical protein